MTAQCEAASAARHEGGMTLRRKTWLDGELDLGDVLPESASDLDVVLFPMPRLDVAALPSVPLWPLHWLSSVINATGCES